MEEASGYEGVESLGSLSLAVRRELPNGRLQDGRHLAYRVPGDERVVRSSRIKRGMLEVVLAAHLGNPIEKSLRCLEA